MANRPRDFRAGAASVCITPEESLWLAGFAARKEPARGALSDLYASAVALEDALGQRFVIASADTIAVTRPIAEQVCELVEQRHALARPHVLLTATHTHYAPEFREDKQLFFNIPPDYAAQFPGVSARLVDALTEAIGQSLERLEPATLVVRKANVGFAHNRRRHGVVDGTASKDDVTTHDVPVLDCINHAGKRIAIAFGYACHNATIPPDDLRYCGDWAGFAKEQLAQAHPGATALFLPGAGADQNPEPSGSVELSRQHGQSLANAVLQSLDRPGIVLTGGIQAAFKEPSLPLQPVTRELLDRMARSDDPPQQVKSKYLLDQLDRGKELITAYPAPVQVVRLGSELLLVALSGEPVVDWAAKLKHELADRASSVWVAGYCNDMFGYLPTRRVQEEGGYEGGRAYLWSWIPAPFTMGVEDRITEVVHRLVGRLDAKL